MESTAKSSYYLSAYPLKAVKDFAINKYSPDSPYLKALLSGKSKNTARKTSFNPLINLFKKYRAADQPVSNRLTKGIELTEKGWFNNYE